VHQLRFLFTPSESSTSVHSSSTRSPALGYLYFPLEISRCAERFADLYFPFDFQSSYSSNRSKHLMNSVRSSVSVASRPSPIVFPARVSQSDCFPGPLQQATPLFAVVCCQSARPQSAPPRARFCCQIRCSPSFLRCAIWSLLCFVTLPWPGPAVLSSRLQRVWPSVSPWC
jgi:hypothetical protein